MKNGTSIYLCKRSELNNTQTPTYQEPVQYVLRNNYLTVQGASGYLDTLAYGERINNFWNCIAKQDIFQGVFHEGDLVYIEGEVPEETTEENEDTIVYGENANAKVRSVITQDRVIRIVFEKVL
ncbi:MAG: hypothetical protein EOM05_12100 [Clostridia bacterium]|nr:hypothetical protein [Clostridia bacterium]